MQTAAITPFTPQDYTPGTDYDSIRPFFERVHQQGSDYQRKALTYVARAAGRWVGWREIEDHFGWPPRTIHPSLGGAHTTKGPFHGWATEIGVRDDGTW